MVSINCDMGEGYGIWALGDDAALMPLITHANLACGFHASDPSIMRKTVRMAQRHGVNVGAHPSLPDRQGFGRRPMSMEAGELTDLIVYQVGALAAIALSEGVRLTHIKPHGALYGMTCRDLELARALCEAAAVFALPIMGLAGSSHERACAELQIDLIPEFYSDLEYDDDGSVIAPRQHREVDPLQAARRVERALQQGAVDSVTGRTLPVRATSICVHSDTPNAVAVARLLHRSLLPVLDRAGIQ